MCQLRQFTWKRGGSAGSEKQPDKLIISWIWKWQSRETAYSVQIKTFCESNRSSSIQLVHHRNWMVKDWGVGQRHILHWWQLSELGDCVLPEISTRKRKKFVTYGYSWRWTLNVFFHWLCRKLSGLCFWQVRNSFIPPHSTNYSHHNFSGKRLVQ